MSHNNNHKMTIDLQSNATTTIGQNIQDNNNK